MKNENHSRLVLAAVCLSLGICLPFLTAQIAYIGNMLLPMHIPVFICGFVCGWKYGMLVGFITPLFRSVLFGMPVLYPGAVSMCLELLTYGLICGVILGMLCRRTNRISLAGIYLSMGCAMLAGRAVWGLVQFLLSLIDINGIFTFQMFFTGAFAVALPGIVLQLLIVPYLVKILLSHFQFSYYLSEKKAQRLQEYIDMQKGFQIIALEGKCASGKTTIANRLKGVTLIDVDDFFLNDEQKTPERLAEIGGNIDYLLYLDCVRRLKPNTTISYRAFDCKKQEYYNKTASIGEKVLLVGVYSYHPAVRAYIDSLCYLRVSPGLQKRRLRKRRLYQRFIDEWIPLENQYYDNGNFETMANLLL